MDAQDGPGPEDVVVGLVAAPGPAGSAVEPAALQQELARRYPGTGWHVVPVVDALVVPPATDDELVDAARDRLLAAGWDLAVCLTDLPLQLARRPVVAHASPVHGVALVSVPALGPVGLRRRGLALAVQLVEELLGGGAPDVPGEGDRARGRRLRHRARQLAADPRDDGGEAELRFTARVLTGNLRLLAGMVRANRPWRLAYGLSRALTGALAAGVFALVTPDLWAMADAFGALRHAAVAAVAVGATAATLVVGAGLWERAPHRRVRKQVALFNLATTATVLLGVLTLYAVLLALSLLGAGVLVVPDLLAAALGHGAGPGDYLEVAWLTTSLATVGGALGAGLESDAAVRQAAYAYRGSEVAPADA
ncbi:hypothetical protein [Vallicoccus soli]|uniref:hypothetical protein n=1 Tax=Vallicoccus soli TaxID=2339232 RepID=UPI001C49AAA5|nr:hypothetical protein [Vallicoccus soli]